MTSVKTLVLGRHDTGVAEVTKPKRRSKHRWTRWIGLSVAIAIIALVIVWALAPQLVTAGDPLYADPVNALQAPSWEHIFGTDNIGRDLYTRMVYGSSTSLEGSAIAIIVALGIGGLIGMLAGFFGGMFDSAIMRGVDVLLAIPALLLSMAVVTALGFGISKVALAVGLGSVAVFARLMRAEVYRVVSMRYIEASRLVGSSRARILFKHILPNSSGTLLTLAALEFGGAILAISALSFLGYGTPPPDPEWGSLISEGRDYMASAWWLAILPGVVIVAVVLSANRISRAFDSEQRVTTW